MQNPSRHHFGAAKRILRYVTGTLDLGIWYEHGIRYKLIGYTDSDWAGCMKDRKSTFGYIFDIGSGAVSWSSKKQATVALSSSEAKYIAASATACQAIWLRRLLGELDQQQKEATEVLCDNKAAIAMSKNPVHHGRTKHVDIRAHFIRELVAEGEISMQYCESKHQLADLFMKPLAKDKFVHLRGLLGICEFGARGSVENAPKL